MIVSTRIFLRACGAILLAVVVGFGSQPAAAIQGPGDLGILSVPGGTLIGNGGLSGDFDDVYSFQVASDASFGSKLLSISFSSILNIQDFTTSLWQGGVELATGTFQTVSASGYDLLLVSTLQYSPLSSNLQYELLVEGTSTGKLASLYSGAIALKPVVTAVPEPEVYAMLLTGLGIMGWAAKRRKHNRVAV